MRTDALHLHTYTHMCAGTERRAVRFVFWDRVPCRSVIAKLRRGQANFLQCCRVKHSLSTAFPLMKMMKKKKKNKTKKKKEEEKEEEKDEEEEKEEKKKKEEEEEEEKKKKKKKKKEKEEEEKKKKKEEEEKEKKKKKVIESFETSVSLA